MLATDQRGRVCEAHPPLHVANHAVLKAPHRMVLLIAQGCHVVGHPQAFTLLQREQAWVQEQAWDQVCARTREQAPFAPRFESLDGVNGFGITGF